MKLYNTLSRKVEEFVPVKEGKVGIYSCGPTVYWNQHIGHMYAYTHWDALVRAFKYLGYEVKWVMNITDVGHLTSDEDTGEDKMEKGAKREGKSVWDIANQYIDQFKDSMGLMNINPPDVLCRATEYVPEMIELNRLIEKNGFTYQTKTGLVFDTGKFPGYADFARLKLDDQNAGARVEVDPEKKKPWDFLLWINNQPEHIMKWDSPWGVGFPGWHIECTAMSTKHLGETFDIHTGGKEHVGVHHSNEIAQGYGAFGHQTANYWLHNEWLMLKGQKVSKSLGNFITVQQLIEKRYSQLALRYLFFNSHYRTGMDFTWENLKGAEKALSRLYEMLSRWQMLTVSGPVNKRGNEVDMWEKRFKESLEDDLNMPKAIATVWEMVKSDLEDQEKLTLLLRWDEVLGLNLEKVSQVSQVPQVSQAKIPNDVTKLIEEREKARKEKRWSEADEVRKKIIRRGYVIKDNKNGFTVEINKR